MEKLGSGYRINRASDDAAGLVISEKMRGQIRGLNQADQNIQNGISLLQTADGALNEVHSILQRMGELSVQAATDTYTDKDRESINEEFMSMRKEINRISRQTEFNTKRIIFDDAVAVGGTPGDISIYTTNSGEYGGIVYRGVRYDWSKFKAEDGGNSLDSAVPKDGNYYLETVGGTKLYFTMDKGKDIPDISKRYDLKADVSAIQIDDYSYHWSDVVNEDGEPINTSRPKEGLYSLDHQGSLIEFYVNEGDTIDDIILQLNESGAGTDSSWISEVSGSNNQLAVFNLNRNNSSVDITSSNKNNIKQPAYTIHADATGIQVDSNTKVSWDQLQFTPPHYGETQGIDFDNGKGIGENTVITFECPDTDVSFSFTISREASRNEVIAGLNNVNVPTSIYSPIQAQLTLDNSGSPVMTGASINNYTGINISFETQRDDMGLDFDSDSWLTATSSSDFDIEFAGTTFSLNNAERNKLDSFFRYGTSNSVQLVYQNASSETIAINFTKTNNMSDGSRPSDPLSIAMDGYVTGLIDDFKSQFSNSTFQIRSDNASMLVSNIDENSMGSGNSTNATYFGVKPKKEEPTYIQAGANSSQKVAMYIGKMGTAKLGIGGEGVAKREDAQENISIIHKAIEIVSEERSKIGAYQNRLEHSMNNINNAAENLQNAESKIRDTNMADEMVHFSKQNILEQVAQSMLAQANQSSQGVLALLG
jgi:flagellin